MYTEQSQTVSLWTLNSHKQFHCEHWTVTVSLCTLNSHNLIVYSEQSHCVQWTVTLCTVNSHNLIVYTEQSPPRVAIISNKLHKNIIYSGLSLSLTHDTSTHTHTHIHTHTHTNSPHPTQIGVPAVNGLVQSRGQLAHLQQQWNLFRSPRLKVQQLHRKQSNSSKSNSYTTNKTVAQSPTATPQTKQRLKVQQLHHKQNSGSKSNSYITNETATMISNIFFITS